ncbi:MAG: hypothetical protein WCC18_18630 [Candidatus Acidiferrales bacterium]
MPVTATQVNAASPVTWEQLQQCAPWDALTAKQKLFVTIFAGTGDPLYATKAAYRSEKNARILSYEMCRNPKIRAALAFYQGKDERELFLAELRRTIDHSAEGSIAKVKAQGLYARLAFGVEDSQLELAKDPKPTAKHETTPKYRVGDFITQDGAVYRIKTLDAAGNPLIADLVESNVRI